MDKKVSSQLLLVMLLVCFLMLAFCIEPVKSEWQTTQNQHFIIYYYPGYDNDAAETLNTAMTVREITLQKYPHDLGIKVIIYIYPDRSTLLAEKGVPTALAEVGSPPPSATIYILCPSWAGDWGGYEQLDSPFRRVLNHEYVHAPFYIDLYTKPSGYSDPPSWFSQGVAEYIGQNYLPSYETRVREAVQADSFTPEAEPYSWGLYIVEYMYTEYGQDKVTSLIISTASTFEDALDTELGVSPSDFENGWKAYLVEKFGFRNRDLNGDSKVNILDIAIAALAFLSYPSHARWNPAADINRDNIVNILDIAKIVHDFGKSF